jgi:hypothetical protein
MMEYVKVDRGFLPKPSIGIFQQNFKNQHRLEELSCYWEMCIMMKA